MKFRSILCKFSKISISKYLERKNIVENVLEESMKDRAILGETLGRFLKEILDETTGGISWRFSSGITGQIYKLNFEGISEEVHEKFPTLIIRKYSKESSKNVSVGKNWKKFWGNRMEEYLKQSIEGFLKELLDNGCRNPCKVLWMYHLTIFWRNPSIISGNMPWKTF